MAQRFFDKVPARAASLLKNIRPTAYAVLGALCSYANERGSCWPSIRSIATKVGVCDKTVRRALAVLCDKGLISRVKRNSFGNKIPDLYQIIYHPVNVDTSVHPLGHQCPESGTPMSTQQESRTRNKNEKEAARKKGYAQKEKDYGTEWIDDLKETEPKDDDNPF